MVILTKKKIVEAGKLPTCKPVVPPWIREDQFQQVPHLPVNNKTVTDERGMVHHHLVVWDINICILVEERDMSAAALQPTRTLAKNSTEMINRFQFQTFTS